MNLNQKKFLWIAGIALAIFYFAPTFINSYRRAAYIRQMEAARLAKAQAAQKSSPLPASTVPVIPTQFESLIGVWQGAGPQGQVGCNLRLELRRSFTDPGHFTGFPVLACTPIVSPFERHSPAQVQSTITAAFTPMTAVLTGTPQNGTIQFTVDRVIGKTPNGCAMTSFTLTPYGNDLIAAEWNDGLCSSGDQHGQLLLKRIGK
jgi:hypothetical protein